VIALMKNAWLSALAVVAVWGSFFGCASSAPEPEVDVERPFALQLRDVKTAITDSIIVETVAVPPEELTQLEGLEGLRELRLTETPVDDETAKWIGTIDSLQVLNLPKSMVTDSGLAQLVALPQLELLRIGSPKLTSGCYEPISQSETILYLHLLNSPIDDKGLQQLAQMKQLESFYIDGTDVSEDAISALLKEMPELHVHYNDLHPAGHAHDHHHDHAH